MRCGCGAVAFIFSIYLKPVLYHHITDNYSNDNNNNKNGHHFLITCIIQRIAGTGVTLISVVLVDLIGMDGLNEAFGMSNLFTGLGTLLGPPLAGTTTLSLKSSTFTLNLKLTTELGPKWNRNE